MLFLGAFGGEYTLPRWPNWQRISMSRKQAVNNENISVTSKWLGHYFNTGPDTFRAKMGSCLVQKHHLFYGWFSWTVLTLFTTNAFNSTNPIIYCLRFFLFLSFDFSIVRVFNPAIHKKKKSSLLNQSIKFSSYLSTFLLMVDKRGVVFFFFFFFFHILENLTPDVGVNLDIFFPLWRK